MILSADHCDVQTELISNDVIERRVWSKSAGMWSQIDNISNVDNFTNESQ